MEDQKAAGSVFMCRMCNLFSSNRALLLSHCTQQHPEQECPDDIITALQPLVGGPVEVPAECPVKRKRGRPKGSTKKKCTDLTEPRTDSTCPPEDKPQKQGEKNKKKEGYLQTSSLEGESHDGSSGLECRDCRRSFRSRRQILKHICLREEEEEVAEEDNDVSSSGSTGVAAGADGSGSLKAGKAASKQTHKKPARAGLVQEKDGSSVRAVRTNRSRISKDGCSATGGKKSVISVVLTEDETLPGVCKMVPVEDGLAERQTSGTKSLPQSAVFQCQSHDSTNEVAIVESNTNVEETSSDRTSMTTTAAAPNKGFQEYCIKQDATNLLQSELKIFACEFCNKIFKFRHSLVAHLRTHTQEKPFQCPHCDYASAIKANLNVHLRKHTGEKFSCPHCPFNCLSPGHLKVHIERVHMKVKQHCSFCEKKYSDVKNLLKHIEKRHSMKDPKVQQTYQQLRLKTRQGLRQLLYHCSTCNRRFKNQLERERHMMVHGPQRPFACLLCDHAATKMGALAAHVRKHLFLYACCWCESKFVSSQKLRSHLEESHSELEQGLAFANCINDSYYLIQPGGGKLGDEETEDAERRMMGELEGERNGVDEEEWPRGVVEQLEVTTTEERDESVVEVQLTDGETGQVEAVANEGSQQTPQEATTSPTDRQDKATAEESSQTNAADSPEAENTGRHEHNTQSSSSPENINSSLPEDRTQKNTQADKNTKTALSSGNADLSDVAEHKLPSSAPSGKESEKDSEHLHQSAFQQVFSSLPKTRLNMEMFQRLRKVYGELECQYCGKLFWYKVHYNSHVRTHTKEHSHYCTKCNYSSITKSSLKRHMIQKHSGVLLPCSHPGCKYTTPDKYKLQAHLRTHQEQRKRVACPVCQQSYPEHRIKHHMRVSHPDTLPVPGKGQMVQRAEKCPYCDSYFLKNSSDFQQHIWAHQGLKPYICTVCDYAGRSKSNLKTHMNRHNTERHHLCDLCGKKFKSKVTLKSHRLSHTNEGKRFQCSECDFTAISKPNLLRHMEQHAEFKPFRCAHCHYSCNIAGPLKRHYNLKHPDEKYENAGPGLPNPDSLKQQGGMKCPECDFVYGTTWELNRHLKCKHSLKVVEVSVEEEEQLTQTPVAALHDNVNIQQITELTSETHDAVTSMVAMAPGTVVVQQVAEEQEVTDCSNQLMVVNTDGGLTGDQVMVVEDADALQALTVLTQGENTHHYIVYVQEHTVEIN